MSQDGRESLSSFRALRLGCRCSLNIKQQPEPPGATGTSLRENLVLDCFPVISYRWDSLGGQSGYPTFSFVATTAHLGYLERRNII